MSARNQTKPIKMKNCCLLIFSLIICGSLAAQDPATKEDIQKVDSRITELNQKMDKLSNKAVQFGLSVGYRFLTQKSRAKYEVASISPIDSTLQLDRVEDGGLVLSTSVLFNPKFKTEKLSERINALVYGNILEEIVKKNDEGASIPISTQLMLLELYGAESLPVDISSKDQPSPADMAALMEAGQDIDLVLAYNFLFELKKNERAAAKEGEDTKESRKLRKKLRRMLIGKFFIDYVLDRLSFCANLNLIEFSNAQQELSFNRSIEGGLGLSYQINPNLYLGVNWESLFTRQLHDHLKAQEGRRLTLNGKMIGSSEELSTGNDDFFVNRNLSGISFKIIASF